MSRTRLLITFAAAALAVVLPAAVALAGPGAPPTGLLWDGDAAKGTGVFDALERAPGTITVASMAPFGPSFRYETWDNANGMKERCESRGTKGFSLDASKLGQTFYIGWRADLTPMPTTRGRWISFFQLHWAGAGPVGGPVTVRTLGDGQIHLQYVAPNGHLDKNIWSAPLPVGQWMSIVVGFKMTRDNSWFLQFWFNGRQQTFSNGSMTWNGPLFKGDHINVKWGVYRSGPNSGHAVEWVNHPRIGTTLASVMP